MPVMIDLTSAEHGGRTACGACGHSECGASCDCGCPYSALETRGTVEPVVEIEQRYPDEWLALVIPASEDEFAPERAMLVVHSPDDNEVWAAIQQITHNQVVHVYYNGSLATYLAWVDADPPASPGTHPMPVIPLMPMAQ